MFKKVMALCLTLCLSLSAGSALAGKPYVARIIVEDEISEYSYYYDHVGVLAALGILTKTELLLIILGGLFVIETLSVIIQVTSFKTTGKRVFLMSPIHHHFELKGWSETRVVWSFWTAELVFCVLAMLTLHFS